MSQEVVRYSPYYFEMGYQILPFFIALTPDINGHCEIDNLYYASYEATLDDYYECLRDAKKTPPITKENVKRNVVNNSRNLLTYVNRTLQRLRVGNKDNHIPTHIRTISSTIHSRDITVPAEGYVMRVAVSFPCPIESSPTSIL